MTKTLATRRALVTGAGRGIGRAVALAFAEQGASVVLIARTAQEIDAVAAEIRTRGGTALPLVADVSQTDALAAAMKRTMDELGGIDILVNNAGGNVLGAIEELASDQWWNQIQVNLRAPYELCRAFVPGMTERGWGRVVNMSSRFGKVGAPMGTSYCAAKHGIIGFTRALALEVATKGVTVNALCPGQVETDLMQEIFVQRGRIWGVSPAAARERIEGLIPQKRLVSVDEIVPAVLFLVSEGAGRITGEAMNVSGGSVMH